MMKIIINETQYKLLLETEGLDSFMETLTQKMDLSDELSDEIKSVFEKAECKLVSFEKLRGPMGLALHNRLVLNSDIFNLGMAQALLIMFHELAHQYQFKKYGAEKMMEVFIGEISLDDAALAMSKYEAVADEFAVRKMRELKRKGLIDYNDNQIRKGYGNNPSPEMFKNMLKSFRNQLKNSGVDNIDKAAEYIYNMVKG